MYISHMYTLITIPYYKSMPHSHITVRGVSNVVVTVLSYVLIVAVNFEKAYKFTSRPLYAVKTVHCLCINIAEI